nr:unnamed protein product [Callosobruchus analis]
MGDPLCNFCNSAISARSKSIKCDSFCGKLFHAACQGLPADIIRNMEKVNGLFWKCDTCRLCTNEVKELLDGKLAILAENMEQMFSTFRNEFLDLAAKNLSSSGSISSGPKKSYSAVAQGKSAIIIKPKDTKQDIQTTKSDLLQCVNPVDENINLSGVKTIRNGGMLVGCTSSNDSTKLKRIATEKLADKYEIKEVSSFHPRLRIAGMTQKLSENDIVRFISSQNKSLLSDHFLCKVLEVKPIRKRNDIFQAVVQFDVDTYNKIMSVGNCKVFVGYNVCDVFDVIDVKRCFNCCEFSHFSNQCKSSQLHCPRCGENHLVKNCKASTLRCINCVKSNNDKNTDFLVDHAAWDSRCPCYLQRVEEIKSSLIFS